MRIDDSNKNDDFGVFFLNVGIKKERYCDSENSIENDNNSNNNREKERLITSNDTCLLALCRHSGFGPTGWS